MKFNIDDYEVGIYNDKLTLRIPEWCHNGYLLRRCDRRDELTAIRAALDFINIDDARQLTTLFGFELVDFPEGDQIQEKLLEPRS